MQVLAEHNADGGDTGKTHARTDFFHHVQAGAERQSKANQRHHQHHMVAEIIHQQLHQQNVQTSQNHADHAPERAQHRAAIMHRKQDQNARHQRRQRIAQVANMKDQKNHCRHRTGKQRLVANPGVIFLNARRRLAGFHVRDQIMQQRAQRHRHDAGFHIGEHQRMPVGGGIAHKIEHRALAHHAH